MGRITHAIKTTTSGASATTTAAAIKLAIAKAEADEAGRNWRAASILEGLAEILTVSRLNLPAKLRRLLASTNSTDNTMGTARRGFHRMKAQKHEPATEQH